MKLATSLKVIFRNKALKQILFTNTIKATDFKSNYFIVKTSNPKKADMGCRPFLCLKIHRLFIQLNVI